MSRTPVSEKPIVNAAVIAPTVSSRTAAAVRLLSQLRARNAQVARRVVGLLVRSGDVQFGVHACGVVAG
jgi:hypothetical protein